MKNFKVDSEIELKLISLASAELIFNAINNSRKHLRKWLPFVDDTKSINDTKNFIKSVLNSNCQKKDEIFEIWYYNTFAGLIGFKEIDIANSKTEMGYWLVAQMTGKGIMTKVCHALTDYAFNEIKLNRVMIKVAVGNEKSKAIPKNLNYQLEGTERAGEYLHGVYQDLAVYSMLKQEWKS